MKLKSILKQVPLMVALVALALTMGCHSSSTPTSETEFQIQVTGSIANSSLMPTIQEAELVFDGTVAVDSPYIPAVAVATLSAAGTASNGPHSIGFLIVNQTTTTTATKYTVPAPSVLVYDLAGTLLKTIQLPSASQALVPGQSITYSFSL